MTLNECFTRLEIAASAEKLGMEWERSQESFPRRIPFLEPQFLRDVGLKYLGNDEWTESLLQSSARLQKNPNALRLLWHFHYLVVQNYERHWMKCYLFPELPILEKDSRPFYLLLALSGAFHFGPVHEKLKIPFELLEASIGEIRTSIQGSIKKKGLVGVAPHYSGWWQGFFSGRLYRLGRLTFLQERFHFPYHLFETKERDLKVFAIDGQKFNAQGLSLLPGEKSAWQAEFSETPSEIRGTLISADGFAREKMESFPKSGWQKIANAGEPIVSVHISGGEPMNTEACADSFVRAKSFHEKYFPNDKFPIFTCDTWLLDPQLQKVLKEDSNIVQFQKRFFLAPNPRDSEFVPIRTIFGPQALVVGYENVEHKTSLQKAAAQLKDEGHTLRHGIGFLPWDRPWQKTH
jgi:hypothetical protein